jgi:hypothetical protein
MICFHNWGKWSEAFDQQVSPDTAIKQQSKVCEEVWFVTTCPKMIYKYPDFSDPREVLKVVMEREDWEEFSGQVIEGEAITHPHFATGSCYIKLDYITTPGKLRDAWIEWKEKT